MTSPMPDDVPSECGHDWTGPDPKGNGLSGPHTCLKPFGHDLDPTDDDHRCCCGANTWATP